MCHNRATSQAFPKLWVFFCSSEPIMISQCSLYMENIQGVRFWLSECSYKCCKSILKCKTQALFCFGFNLELNIHPDTRVVSGDNKHFCIWSVCRWIKRMSEAFAIRWLISANKSYCVRVHVWRQSINKIRDYWGIPTATTSSTATTLKNRNNQIIAKYKIQIIRVKKSKYENQYAPKYPLMGPQANWSGI